MARIHIKLYKNLHNPDNHDGVIIHLEPGILECEVKWALENITTNKASGGDGISVELFQILNLQSFPASGSFPMNQFFTLGGQSIEAPPTPQFKSINSLTLSFLYSPALTSMHDYWKNHSFNYIELLHLWLQRI